MILLDRNAKATDNPRLKTQEVIHARGAALYSLQEAHR